MGFKKRERWPVQQWRAVAETVEIMIRDGWTVTTRCGSCRVELDVNLYLVAATKGPRTSLWNKTTPCKVSGCKGRMAFHGRPPDLAWPMPLKAALMPGSPRALGQSRS